MPLSDHEQRLLEQIERALYAEDPKFASTVRTTDLRHFHRRRTYRALFVALVGIGVLVGGLISGIQPITVVGAILIVCGVLYGIANWKRLTGGAPRRRRERTRSTDGHLSLVERFEERWQRRWDQQDF